MRSFCLLLFLAFTGIRSFPQKIDTLFDEAYQHHVKKEYDTALILYQRFIKKNRGSESVIACARFNIGVIYEEKKDVKKATKVFLDILDTDKKYLTDESSTDPFPEDPYAEYRNFSCNELAEIALDEKNYTTALNYIRMAKEVYPFRHFCGNAHETNNIYHRTMSARCHAGLKDTSMALQELLPKCFENPFADNQPVVELAVMLIRKKYCSADISLAIEKAVRDIVIEESKTGEYIYYTGIIKLFDVEITFYPYYSMPKSKKEEDFFKTMSPAELLKHKIMKDKFYQLLTRDRPLSIDY